MTLLQSKIICFIYSFEMPQWSILKFVLISNFAKKNWDIKYYQAGCTHIPLIYVKGACKTVENLYALLLSHIKYLHIVEKNNNSITCQPIFKQYTSIFKARYYCSTCYISFNNPSGKHLAQSNMTINLTDQETLGFENIALHSSCSVELRKSVSITVVNGISNVILCMLKSNTGASEI